jgi:DNA repair protein RecN (Recombination protein N)
LLRGGRSSVELIRSGRDEARVEAAIDLPPGPATARLRERLVAEGRIDEGELVVRRTINRSGRGRVHVGRGLGTASDLAATLGGLVDIASQHDQQNLTNPENQLAILDAFAEAIGLRAEMAAAHQALEAARAELSRFDADSRTRAEREDLLRYQLAELDAASLTDEREDETLKLERDRLRHAEKLGAAAAHGDEVLYSGDDAMVGKIAAVARELGAVATLDPFLGELAARLRESQVVVEDIGRELARYASTTRPEPARLAEVEERLFLLSRLARKHGHPTPRRDETRAGRDRLVRGRAHRPEGGRHGCGGAGA